MQRKSHTLEGLKDQSNKEGIIRKHHSFQRLLEPYAVVNPYAEELFYKDDRLQTRRDQPKFLNLGKAVAFFNQMKKPLKNYNGIDYIEVSREDIQQATELASRVIGNLIGRPFTPRPEPPATSTGNGPKDLHPKRSDGPHRLDQDPLAHPPD